MEQPQLKEVDEWLESSAGIIKLFNVFALFKEGMMKLLGITDEQIQSVVDNVVSALPGYLQRSLSIANGLTIAA